MCSNIPCRNRGAVEEKANAEVSVGLCRALQFGATVKPGKLETLDIDDTFCAAHGGQQLAFWNAHHDERGFASMHIYHVASGTPVAAILRPARTPKGSEVCTVIKHVTKRLRRHSAPSPSASCRPAHRQRGRVPRRAADMADQPRTRRTASGPIPIPPDGTSPHVSSPDAQKKRRVMHGRHKLCQTDRPTNWRSGSSSPKRIIVAPESGSLMTKIYYITFSFFFFFFFFLFFIFIFIF